MLVAVPWTAGKEIGRSCLYVLGDRDLRPAHAAGKDLEFFSELIEAGKVRPKIERSYPFTEIPEAVAYLERGHARVKVVAWVA